MQQPNRIRILFVIASLAGGPRTGIRNILLHLDRQNFEPFVAYFHIKGIVNIPETYWEELRRAGVPVWIFKMCHPLDFMAFLRFFLFLARMHFSVLYLPLRLLDSIGSLMAHVLGIPVFVSKHGFPQHNTVKSHIKLPWHIKRAMYVSEKLSTSLATRIRTVSRANKSVYIRLFGVKPTKIVVIPNGLELADKIDSSETVFYRESILKGCSGVKVIGLVGSLVPIKGHSTYIRAAALVKERMSNVKWLIVCDVTEKMRPYQRELLALAKRLEVEDMVEFINYRPDVYAILDVAVVPSFIEDCPHVVLEAMKYGKAVVASKVGGIPELVTDGETGLLFPPLDHQRLADKLLYLLEDVSRPHLMGVKGRERLRNNFCVHNVVKALEREIQTIAKSG